MLCILIVLDYHLISPWLKWFNLFTLPFYLFKIYSQQFSLNLTLHTIFIINQCCTLLIYSFHALTYHFSSLSKAFNCKIIQIENLYNYNSIKHNIEIIGVLFITKHLHLICPYINSYICRKLRRWQKLAALNCVNIIKI